MNRDDDLWCAVSLNERERQPRIDVLRTLTLAEFAAGLQCARERRDDAAQVYDEYSEWYTALEPYLRRDPNLTVDDALTMYQADCRMNPAVRP